ncbi:MAG: T9SS type A sorting domain-containing protein [Ignavibacteria bacterium]|nr:T9SS type A sorting domain-containing protein [Ignavibacteria bacterium]
MLLRHRGTTFLKFVSAGLFITVFLLLCRETYSQEIASWKILGSMRDIKCGVVSNNGLWGGTISGAFYYSFADSQYTRLTKVEGLSGYTINAMVQDKYGKVWMGCENGQIDICTRSDNGKITVVNKGDIKTSDLLPKAITQMNINGDTVFVSTGFGVVLYDAVSLNVIDNYLHFPANGKDCGSVVKQSGIYVVVGGGVAVQKSGNLDLNLPSSWNYFSNLSYPILNGISKLIAYQGNVIGLASGQLILYKAGTWVNYDASFPTNIIDIAAKGDSLLLLTKTNQTLVCYKGTTTTLSGLNASTSGILAGGSALFFTSSNGIEMYKTPGNLLYFFPDGPQENKIYAMKTGKNGTLYVATGKNDAGRGVFIYDGLKWNTINAANSGIASDAVVSVYARDDGSFFCGTWGFGFFKVQNGGITSFTTQNTPLRGVPETPNFLIINGIGDDSRNNLWLLNFKSANNAILSALTPDSTWYDFQYGGGNIDDFLMTMMIDKNDTKWFLTLKNKQLYYYNENGTLANSSDDVWGVAQLSSSANGEMNAVIADQRGEVWLGTSSGMYLLASPELVYTAKGTVTFSSVYALRQYVVTAIAIDGLNRKWVATNRGLLLVSSEGDNILAQYNVDNSPLLTNDIKQLEMDLKNGILYIGTDYGIIAAYTSATQPGADFSALKVYPNPVRLNSASIITFDGLVKDTEIKILDITGRELIHIVTPGSGKAYWNGKDSNGNLLASGIYFAICYDKDGQVLKTTKIAVVRK